MRRAALAVPLIFVISATSTLALAPVQPKPLPASEFRPVPLPAARKATPTPAATPVPVSVDPRAVGALTLPSRPAVKQPAPSVGIKLTPGEELPAMGGNHLAIGRASWYCRAGHSPCVNGYPDTGGFDAYAAAGPKLRIAMGGGAAVTAPQPWRGKIVTVCGVVCRRVKLIDWCQCHWKKPGEKLIDLYYDVFKVVSGRSGVTKVKVMW